jgi:DNA polymerase III alpha subunit
LEDLTGSIEVFLWDDTYSKVAELLALGRVIAVQATVDNRDDRARAVAQKVKVLTGKEVLNVGNKEANGSHKEQPLLLRFSPTTTRDELQEVREILAGSPGRCPVRFLFDRTSGDPLRLDAGAEFQVNLTQDLEQKLARWLVATKAERGE